MKKLQMVLTDDTTLPAFKYLSGESVKICRLCFGSTESGVYLDECRHIQCYYFDDTVTFENMLQNLGATMDASLPQMLCENCGECVINSFLLLKLCQKSHNQWHESLEKFNKALDLSETLGSTVKTAYLILKNDSSLILTSRKVHKEKSKEVALSKIRYLMKARQAYDKVKKKLDVVCDECGEKFPSSSCLTRHMRQHSNKKHPCKQCPKVFPSKAQLRDHSERIHKPKTIQCPKCAKMFSSEKMLKYHNTTHHTAALCKLCFTQFPSKKELRQHLDRHDVNKCPRCNKEFTNKQSFKVHIKICGNEEEKQSKFFCDICNKEYARKNGLRSHLITAHNFGRVYTCDWCKKPFDAVSKLRNHVVKHTKERNFHCDQCGSQFVTMPALVYHVRIHTGEKPFPCDMCDESFLSASRRMEHKRRKHLGPSRECHICHNKFVTGHELSKHLARHKNPQSRLFVSENEGENNNFSQKRKIIYF